MMADVKFSEISRKFDVALSTSLKSFNVKLGKVHGGGETHAGPYPVTPKAEQNFGVVLSNSPQSFGTNFGNVQEVARYIGGEIYAGPYTVTPKVDAQTMATKDKAMSDDVTIKAIPVYDVSNTSGGTTFYIATAGEEPDGGKAILGQMKLGAIAL